MGINNDNSNVLSQPDANEAKVDQAVTPTPLIRRTKVRECVCGPDDVNIHSCPAHWDCIL